MAAGEGEPVQTPQWTQVPADTLLVKGAWSSASDSTTPVPEGGTVGPEVYSNEYFGLTYPLPANWTEPYSGPPPSDSGYYYLAQLSPEAVDSRTRRGTVLIAAHDLFFTPTPVGSALQMVAHARDSLSGDYRIEEAPAVVRIRDRLFVRFAYSSPGTGLHWYVLATEIRCHSVQFIYTSGDSALIRKLVRDFSRIAIQGSPVPVCLRDYAGGSNVLQRVEPVLIEHRLNPIPVRIIIDREGKVRHLHFLSAFPSEAKSITDALLQWRFKPYLLDGRPVEVETGLVFGRRE